MTNTSSSLLSVSAIVAFAAGDALRFEAAVQEHRRLNDERPDLSEHAVQRFMREVDTPVPDLLHRATLRRQVLAMADQGNVLLPELRQPSWLTRRWRSLGARA